MLLDIANEIKYKIIKDLKKYGPNSKNINDTLKLYFN